MFPYSSILMIFWYTCHTLAQVAELVDAIDSKSIDGNIMRVQFSPWAHNNFLIYML